MHLRDTKSSKRVEEEEEKERRVCQTRRVVEAARAPLDSADPYPDASQSPSFSRYQPNPATPQSQHSLQQVPSPSPHLGHQLDQSPKAAQVEAKMCACVRV